MHRFYTAPGALEHDVVEITGEDLRHLSRVLRLCPGETIALCDGAGHTGVGEIEAVDGSCARVRVTDRADSDTENRTARITLFQGVPKSGKMETIVQKNTELGVCAFVPFYAKRSVVRPSKSDTKKTARLRRVAYEASKQCGRGVIPEVSAPVVFDALPEKLKDYDLVLCAYENADGATLRSVLEAAKHVLPVPAEIAVIVGPEGGFEDVEIKRLKAAGARVVSLGRRILRTETAGMATAAQINYAFDE